MYLTDYWWARFGSPFNDDHSRKIFVFISQKMTELSIDEETCSFGPLNTRTSLRISALSNTQ